MGANMRGPESTKSAQLATGKECGDMGEEGHRVNSPKSIKFAVITVSDTQTEADDRSGDAITQLMQRAGHKSIRKAIVKNGIPEIQRALREFIEDPRIQAVLINGGTGVARRDVTLEAVSHFEEKPLPGFGELFRALGFQEMGSEAMMSRATAFVSEGKIVFCLPDSEKAVKLATEKLIAPELGRIVSEANR